ncbi:AAA family ATPase [Poseidonibacter ostreae]|uniref:AAA family ATPase n=1 Tax=Poseidonibacter ostreae TaxID=2654171 RepID=A0A6L4WWI5_9BACT|nr:AAA family ATPase [Poseidonibacter ostreae]KAB7891298.1 AAA family ATPase [Poseidonibacter ostreae]
MIYLLVEDIYFYDKLNDFELLRNKISYSNKHLGENIKDKKIKVIFDKESLTTALYKEDFASTVILSPLHPKTFNMDTPFFGVFKVDNSEGLLTKSEKDVGLKEYKKLNDALGLVVEESSLNFSDSNQDPRLVEVARLLALKLMLGEIPDAVFLAGIMGTGKSYFAQCLAGETGRLLVSFNLAKIMNEPNPIEQFDIIIDYLVENDGKYLLWIDEIDKIFNGSPESEHIKNKFLTFLNDLGTTIEMDTLVVMTANNVTDILTKFPEMIRAGRVEPFAKIFLNLLDVQSAVNTANLYIKKRNSIDNKRKTLANILLTLKEGNDSILMKDIGKYAFYKNIVDKLEHIKQIDTNVQKYKLVKKDKVNLYLDEIDNIFTEEEREEIFNSLHLDVDGDYLVDYIDRIYRSIHPKTKIVVFYYVHAEVKEIVSQLYLRNIMSKFKSEDTETLDEALESIVRDNIAIADAGEDAINKMLGNLDKFSIVIPNDRNIYEG